MDRRGSLLPRLKTNGKNLTVKPGSKKTRNKDVDVISGRECNIFKMIPKLRDIQGEQCSETFRTRLPKSINSFKKTIDDDDDGKFLFPDISDSGVKRKHNRSVNTKTRKTSFSESKKHQSNLGCLPEI